MNVWNELGIEPTRDLRTIKLAYAARLKQSNPEDDAAAFQRLRQAYDFAQAYARATMAPAKALPSEEEPAPPPPQQQPQPAAPQREHPDVVAPPTAAVAAQLLLGGLQAAQPRKRRNLLEQMLRQPGWESLDFRQQLEAAVVQALLRDFERLQPLVETMARHYGWRQGGAATPIAMLLARSAAREWWQSIANTSLKKSQHLRQALVFLSAPPDEAAFRRYGKRAANRLAMHQVLVKLQTEYRAALQFDVDRASLKWWIDYDSKLKDADRRVYDYSGLMTVLFWLCLGGALFWIGHQDDDHPSAPYRPPAQITPAGSAPRHPGTDGVPAIQLPQSGPRISSTALPTPSQRSASPPDYLADIDRAVSAQVHYPAEALRDGHEGTVVLQLDLRRDGSVERLQVLRSSGMPELDAEATAAVNRVGRFPAAPPDAYAKASTISFTFPVDFKLN